MWSDATLKRCWLAVVLLRFVWTCLPQYGYIHPDEFFQTVEVAAGDILAVDVVRTWEFKNTFPLRSIIPIYLAAGLPLLLLRAASTFCGHAITWYSVTVSVRLWLTLLSLITDVAAMQLASWVGTDAASAAVVAATSYVSLVYFSRSFSNTLEALLFAALLCLVVRSSRNKTGPSNTVCVSTAIVIGVFNRPTFVVYAAVPYLWWLCSDATGMLDIVMKALVSVLAALPTTASLVVCDSLYYGRLCLTGAFESDSLDAVSFATHNLTATPLNFVLYNTQSGNLAEHGIHPRFTHFLVNIPLLFSALGVLLLYTAIQAVVSIFMRTMKPVLVTRHWKMLMLSSVVPVSLLSVFPHQEPRFLVPLLPVLAALFAQRIVRSRWWVVLWVVWNAVMCLFSGSVHQAGLLPCLGYLQEIDNVTGQRHVVFWHTYTAPRHLLLIQQWSFQISMISPQTSVESLEGSSIGELLDHLWLVDNGSSLSDKPDIMVAAPSSEHRGLVCKAAEAGIQLDLAQSFWPHLSTEHPPSMGDVTCQRVTGDSCRNYDDVECRTRSLVERIQNVTSLNLYKVTFS